MGFLRRRSLARTRRAALSAPFIQRIKDAGIELIPAKPAE
jgi:hypothetical protein